jgi:predicted nucleotide-binding protein (sugar kinase/HSP70/actin superfamily)
MSNKQYPKLPKPFPQAFSAKDKRRRTLLIPNLSRAFTRISAAVFRRAGYRCQTLPVADERAKRLGKQFVHNDICYPAQINIGECLKYVRDQLGGASQFAFALAQNCQDCRAGQYAALARKALDEAGYHDLPIVTTGADSKGMHPGFRLDALSALRFVWGVNFIDALERMRLKLRPYELKPGSTDRIFEESLELIARTMERHPRACLRVFRKVVEAFNAIAVDMRSPRPRVFVIGEILMNYHESANNQLVRYLEKNGLEVVLPDIADFFQRESIAVRASLEKKLVHRPLLTSLVAGIKDRAYRHVSRKVSQVMTGFKYHRPKCSMESLAAHIDGLVDRTMMIGEGWLIPAEIIEHARSGVNSFIIIQPFGCLPNQITGKALIPTLKRMFSDIQILSLDYDADVSVANIENRLQMLIMAARQPRPAHAA